jgi:hypothetical protein
MPEINPPYRFDPIQNPVNVKWKSGEQEGEGFILVPIHAEMLRVLGGNYSVGVSIGDGNHTLSGLHGVLSGTGFTSGTFIQGLQPHSLIASLGDTSSTATGYDANNVVLFSDSATYSLVFTAVIGRVYNAPGGITEVRYQVGYTGIGESYRYDSFVKLRAAPETA